MENDKTMSSARAASKRFADGYRCSEAILAEYCGRVGLDSGSALKIGCALGGGLGGAGEVCGALTASIVILGLKYGRETENDADKRALADSHVRELLRRFALKHAH